jgi:hypothetical protein
MFCGIAERGTIGTEIKEARVPPRNIEFLATNVGAAKTWENDDESQQKSERVLNAIKVIKRAIDKKSYSG